MPQSVLDISIPQNSSKHFYDSSLEDFMWAFTNYFNSTIDIRPQSYKWKILWIKITQFTFQGMMYQ